VSGEFTRDGFLNNRLTVEQPRGGFRAGHDSVFLAAAVPARSGDSVLELGSGAGVASLCLAARVPGCRIMGVEIDAALVALANANAKANGMADSVRFVAGDARSFSAADRFDHVFFNPPFHPASGRKSASSGRDRAMRDSEDAVVSWTRQACALVQDSGTITIILRADRLAELQEGCRAARQTVALLPRAGEAAKRIVVRLFPARPPGDIANPPLILHESDGRPTALAEAVLRHAAALPLDSPFHAFTGA
jgi:tRNA1Val (adenine37-N6)-methyltransferase